MRISDWSSDVCSSDLFATTFTMLAVTPAVADPAPQDSAATTAGGTDSDEVNEEVIVTGTRVPKAVDKIPGAVRSEERRVGTEWYVSISVVAVTLKKTIVMNLHLRHETQEKIKT